MVRPFTLCTTVLRSLRKRGLIGTVHTAGFAARCVIALRGKNGLEIGGPSKLFRNRVPVYSAVRSLDNCVFSTETIWEGERADGSTFNFLPDKPGRNRVIDAVDLQGIEDSEYDFVLSCHSLEHIANPIKALKNWRRVAPGYLLLVLPYYRDTFDHLRPVTGLDHMIADFERNIGEDDLTHLPEVLELIDWSRVELPEGTAELSECMALVKKRSSENPRHRSMHHHVFDERNAIQLVQYCGYRILTSLTNEGSIFVLGKSM
jgi:SAM-dependent methyltransferase